jgi:hypothetical protein
MNPWAILAAVLALSGAVGASYLQGRRDGSSAVIAEQEGARKLAEDGRTKKAASVFRLQETRDADILRTGDQLADALSRLRKRSAVPAGATSSAAGAGPGSGGELSDANREDLLRIGAEAERLRIDYATCRAALYPVK